MDYFLHIGILICIGSILALSLNIISWYAWALLLSQSVFYWVWAYAVAILVKNYDFSFILALILSMWICFSLAFFVSFPILKLKDDALILVSLWFWIIANSIFLNWQSLTNWPLWIKAIPSPIIFWFDFYYKPYFLILSLILAVLTFLFIYKIVNSPYWTILKWIRENELVVKCAWYETQKFKRSAFIISAIFAWVAWWLYASYSSYIDPTLFDLLKSVSILVMIILWWLWNIWWSLLWCIIIVIFPELLRFIGLPDSIMAEAQQILYWILLYVLIYIRPQWLIWTYKI